MKEVSLKNKVLALLAVVALLTSCGSGGGGGGSSSSGGSNIGNNTNTPGESVTLPNSDKDEGSGTSGIFDKNFSSKSALIGIIDSSFDMTRLSVIANQISVDSANKGIGDSKLGNGYTHGENVALIIADGTNNYIYAAGAAKGSNLSISTTMYSHLYNNGVRIFNQSFGSTAELNSTNYPSTSAFTQFYSAKASTDSLFIWATGNESNHSAGTHVTASSDARLPELYPIMEKGWLAVTAVDSDTETIANYANYIGSGSMNWGIAAIGDYKIGSGTVLGTSFATAAVSRAAGNVLNQYPWMGADTVKLTILTTADVKGGARVTSEYGWGLLNETNALKGPAIFDTRLAYDSTGNKTDKITITIDGDKQDSITGWDQLTFSNNISGNAGLILDSINDTGILVMSGQNTYSGDTIIKDAALIITNQLNSKVTVNDTSGSLVAFGTTSLDGGGTARQVKINNDVVNNGELIVMGSQGLAISGNYTGSSMSSIDVDADSKILVSGIMNLNGSEVVITASSIALQNIPSSASYVNNTVIKATGGINGVIVSQLSTDFDNSYIAINTPIYNGSDEITVSYKRNSTSYVASSMSYMSASVMNTGENLDKVFDRLSLTEESSEFKSAASEILRTPTALLPRTLDSLSGEIYASAQNLTFKQSRETNRNLSERLHLINNEENRGGTGVWFNFLGTDGEIYKKGYAKADTELWGGQVGLDTALSDRFIIGGAISATKAKADFNKYAGKSESTSITASIYGIYNFGDDYSGLYTLGRLGVGFVDTDVQRDIWINTKVDHLKANHDDTIYSAYAELGYKIPLNNIFTLTPYIGLSHDTVHRGSFDEKDSSFALKTNSKNYDQTAGVVGLRAEAKLNRVKLHSTLQHMSAFGKEDLSFKAKYVGDTSGDHIKVKGASLTKNITWIGIGAEAQLTDNLSVNASYNISIERSRVSDNIGSIGFRFKF